MKIDNDKILTVAQQAALSAGAYLNEHFGTDPGIAYKGAIDMVTAKDKESQEIIYKIINDNFPGHSILGEEDLNEENDKDLVWLIDPIDGTTNYARSLPAFCVSIALIKEGKTEVGVVYAPLLDEMFHAVRGGGAFLNKKPVRVSPEKDLGKALLATGFPYDRRESPQNNVDNFNKFIVRALGIRRMGSAAIDLCYTAAGRFDGFWEMKLQPWDTAAGLLMVQEAGGVVTDFSGKPFDPFMKECLAANHHIHKKMLEVLAL